MNNTRSKAEGTRWFVLYALPPIGIVALSVGAFALVAVKFRPEAQQKEAQVQIPAVEAVVAEPSRVDIVVPSQGTVQPRTQTTLVAEVSGRVESVAPAFYAGGFFEKGDTLLTIDSVDYESALAAARSRAAEARLAYEQELAASEQALEDWGQMNLDEQAGELVLRKPQLARAQAALEAAEAAVEQAERDLQRTRVQAPYDGLALQKSVDVGQVVTARASQLGVIYSIDVAEVRLPISLEDAGYLDLPETYRDANAAGPKPRAVLKAQYGGRVHEWEAVIDRVENVIDRETRLLYLVAQVKDPYAAKPGSDRPPLKAGLFVSAKIHGPPLEGAYELPRKALRRDDLLFVVDVENRLQIVAPEIYQKNVDTIVVTDGLEPGVRVVVSPMEFAVDGMQVAVQPAAPAPGGMASSEPIGD